MGFLRNLFGRDDAVSGFPPPPVDLEYFTVGQSRIGGAVATTDPFAPALREQDVYDDERGGVEIGAGEGGVLDYVFLDLSRYRGALSAAGVPLNFGTATGQAEVRSRFGEPYWVNRDDGEVVLFYEYKRGTVELQFEFTGHQETLRFITLGRNGVLSDAEQREAYGVTNAWPPAEG